MEWSASQQLRDTTKYCILQKFYRPWQSATSDILWRHADGTTAMWHDANSEWTTWPGALDFTWQIQGVGDFTGDNRSDILWRSVNGANVIWPGGNAPGYWLNALDGNWQVQGVGKFD